MTDVKAPPPPVPPPPRAPTPPTSHPSHTAACRPVLVHTVFQSNRKDVLPGPSNVKQECSENILDTSAIDPDDTTAWSDCEVYTGYLPEPVGVGVDSKGAPILWSNQMVKDPEHVWLPFPRAAFDFHRRLRSRRVVLTCTSKGSGGPMFVHVDPDTCRSIFMRGTCSARCAHRIVPCRISLMGYRTQGTPQQQRVTIALVTDEYVAYTDPDAKTPLTATATTAATASATAMPTITRTARTWFDNSTHSITAQKGGAVHKRYAYALEADTNAMIGPANRPPLRTLYVAPTQCAIANNYVLLSALSRRTNRSLGPAQFYREVQVPVSASSSSSGTRTVYCVDQPNAQNQCPDPISYLYTTSVLHSERGMTSDYIAQNTRVLEGLSSTKNEDEPRHCWQVPRSRLLDLLSRTGKRLSDMNIVMNLDGGMTLQFHPTDPAAWKTAAAAAQPFTITVELQFQYLVIDA